MPPFLMSFLVKTPKSRARPIFAWPGYNSSLTLYPLLGQTLLAVLGLVINSSLEQQSVLTPLGLGFLLACSRVGWGHSCLAGVEGNEVRCGHSEPRRGTMGLDLGDSGSQKLVTMAPISTAEDLAMAEDKPCLE